MSKKRKYTDEQVKDLAVRLAKSEFGDDSVFEELSANLQMEMLKFAEALADLIDSFKNVMNTGEAVFLAVMSAPDRYVQERYAELVYYRWVKFHADTGRSIKECPFEKLPEEEKLKYIQQLMVLYEWLKDI